MLRIPWTQKPPCGTPLDWSNSLTQGMVFNIPCNEQSGPYTDLVTGNRSSSAPSWRAGNVYQSVDQQIKGIQTTTKQQFGTGDFTVMLREKPDPTPGAAKLSLQSVWGTGGSPYQWALAAYYDGAAYSATGYCLYTNAVGTSAVGASGLLDGNTHTFVAVRQGTLHSLYRDGILVAQATKTVQNVTATVAANNVIAFTQFFTATYVGTPGSRELAAGWNRALSSAEVLSVSVNPWQVYQPQLIPFFAQLAATIALWCKVAGSLKAAEMMWIKTGGNLKLVEALNAKVGGAIK
jgi:hypothetical protein